MQPGQAEGQVTVMAAADHAGPDGDLYQLLGVPREASREEIALAWRCRARDEHPDARPADADAPERFRALAGPGRCWATWPAGPPMTAPWPASGSARPGSRCGGRSARDG